MSRCFREHERRTTRSLNGVWEFSFLGDVALDAVQLESVRFEQRMCVPGCFDATPAYAGARGLAAYRTHFHLERSAPQRLVVDGAHHSARFYLDGREVGSHAGGFTRFALSLAELAAGSHELVALVDNRFDSERCPLHLEYFDWYQFGGLTRDVALEEVGDVFIESLTAVTRSIAPPTLEVRIRYRSRIRANVLLGIELSELRLCDEVVALEPGEAVIERIFSLPALPLWSPETPNLHRLQVRLGGDDAIERVGLRVVGVEGGRVCLNGEPLRLLGVNRHESYPECGHAVPRQRQLADLQLFKRLGGNCVRGSHYPQDIGFLDLCDELGVLVWNEAIGWQHREEHLLDARFLSAQEAHIDEMVAMSINRPSVILWGLLNESCSTSDSARAGFARLIAHIRRADDSRPITFATLSPHGDKCLELCDVVSVNTYPGWYLGSLDEIPQRLAALVQHLSETYPGKPLIVSEFGADAIYGFHDYHRQRWSEEYQAELVERSVSALGADARVAGILIWQFCDCRTPEQIPGVLGRARGFNNKGLLDEYRRPKLAFDAARRAFAAIRGE